MTPTLIRQSACSKERRTETFMVVILTNPPLSVRAHVLRKEGLRPLRFFMLLILLLSQSACSKERRTETFDVCIFHWFNNLSERMF